MISCLIMMSNPTVSTHIILFFFYPFGLCFVDTDYDFPATSTPYVRKPSKPPSNVGAKGAAKATKAIEPIKEEDESFEIEYNEVKIGVIASGGMRSITLFKSQSLVQVLTKVAEAMKLPNDYVEMGYDAPWSMKSGTKRIAMFVSNTDDLAEFWRSYNAFMNAPGRKPNSISISFRNMLDLTQVCSIFDSSFILLIHGYSR